MCGDGQHKQLAADSQGQGQSLFGLQPDGQPVIVTIKLTILG